MNNSLLLKLKQKAEELMTPSKMHHDYSHVLNVYRNAETLIEKLGGDSVVILTAALFHDIARDQENHEKVGAEKLRALLNEMDEFPKDKIEETCLVVERHEGGQLTHNEKILADADKMDAFTESGVKRGLKMFADEGHDSEKAKILYLELLEKWSRGFHFEESRATMEENYASAEQSLK